MAKALSCIMCRLSCQSSRGGTRTPDPVINSHLLYQLSYSGSTFGRAKITQASRDRQRWFSGRLNRFVSSWLLLNPRPEARLSPQPHQARWRRLWCCRANVGPIHSHPVFRCRSRRSEVAGMALSQGASIRGTGRRRPPAISCTTGEPCHSIRPGPEPRFASSEPDYKSHKDHGMAARARSRPLFGAERTVSIVDGIDVRSFYIVG